MRAKKLLTVIYPAPHSVPGAQGTPVPYIITVKGFPDQEEGKAGSKIQTKAAALCQALSKAASDALGANPGALSQVTPLEMEKPRLRGR